MNNVSLIGRLTADPELKHTSNDLATTRFSIAVDRSYSKDKQADFINIIAWRQTAEFVCKYFSKGQRIAIVGQIRTGSYTDKDGNKRYTFEVQADNVEFCETKKNQCTENQHQSSKPIYQENYSSSNVSDFVDMPNNEDLPF